ncbi:hypothetical protein LTR70_007727 [Exophiala xenobiotica]|nr:hypothetical protein LTR70_007727 [Exophiala xenobiotica]
MDTNPIKGKTQGHRINIQSKDHETLLNVIDDLRSQGISRFIDLPQIIVCGDQSSGKSSVLEAVSGLRFPTKDALCTRFATELILRRHTEVASKVTIVPDANRPEKEKEQLQNFQSEDNVYENLGTITEDASEAMGLDGSSKNFSLDVLRIELSGPEQPHLTLVDLPGLFHVGSKSQSDADAEAVKSLVTGYMQKSRSIILAVVSAKNDFNNQIITKYAKDFDNDGQRTLGVITKPDTLPAGSDSEKQFFELAENKDVKFRLGWHVLKNRSYEERDCSNEERHLLEKQFFSTSIWMSLPPSQVGITTFKHRLSTVLQRQILSELPSLMADVVKGIQECQMRLNRLGASRGSIADQRRYLHSISEAFTTTVKEAVRGRYDSVYFGDPSTENGFDKRIRAKIYDMCQEFARTIRVRGHKYQVVKPAPEHPSTIPPYRVSKEYRLSTVKELIKRNRGTELVTGAKEPNVTALFREQSSAWASIATDHAQAIFEMVKRSILLALDYTCDESTRRGVLSYIIKPALAKIKQGFDEAVQKTLYQHVHGVLLTLNHYLTENLQKVRLEHIKERTAEQLESYFRVNPREGSFSSLTPSMVVNVNSLLNHLSKQNTEADMENFDCEEALRLMQAYYKASVAQKQFIDDFANYAVEQDLMIKLESIFAPDSIFGLEESTIEDIAGETDESKVEREQSSKKMATLKLALDVLERLDRRNTMGKSSFRSILSVPTVAEVIQLIRDSRYGDVLEDTDEEVETEDSTTERVVEASSQVAVGSIEESIDEGRSESVGTSSDATADELVENPKPLSTQFAKSRWHMHPFDLNHPLISLRARQFLSQIASTYPDHVLRTIQSIVMIRSKYEKMNAQQRLAYTEKYRLQAAVLGNGSSNYLRMNCIVRCMHSWESAQG